MGLGPKLGSWPSVSSSFQLRREIPCPLAARLTSVKIKFYNYKKVLLSKSCLTFANTVSYFN